ncbi:MAG: hypothetical protein QXU31_01530 [Archaeoglobaceae archaeon]
MRAVIFTNKDLDLSGLELKEVYLIFAKGVKGSITVSEMSETIELAQSKLPLIKKAENIVEKLEKIYDVMGMSVVFKDYEEEIESVMDAYKPDLLIAGRSMPLTQNILSYDSAILFYREKIAFDRILYVHIESGNVDAAKKWIAKGREVIVVGIVEPMLPPETHAKRMKECQERINKEISQITGNSIIKKSILIGNLVEEVRRLVEELNPSLLILSKKAGIEKIREILEKVEKNVIFV